MKHTISVLVENHSGVLSRITGLFSRRGFNIDSLAVGPTHDPEVSRITMIADGDEHTVEQIEKQLNKLIEVIKVRTLKKDECFARELMMVKLNCPAEKRSEIMTIAEMTEAKIVDVTLTTVTLEICARFNKLERFQEIVAPYGILELVRTGTIAIQKGADSMQIKK